MSAAHVQRSAEPLAKNARSGFSAKTACGGSGAIASHFEGSHDQKCATRIRGVDGAQRAGANPKFDLAFRRDDDSEICDGAFADFSRVSPDSCTALYCRNCGRTFACRFDHEPARQGEGWTHESRHFVRHVAVRCLSWGRINAVHHSPVARIGPWRACGTRSLGSSRRQPPVLCAVIQPTAAWSAAQLFFAELVGTGVIIFAVGYFLSIPRLAPLVPWLVGILIGLGTGTLGTQSGGSFNPARQFGPAVVSGHTDRLWVFLVAPMLGAEGAARLLRAFSKESHALPQLPFGPL